MQVLKTLTILLLNQIITCNTNCSGKILLDNYQLTDKTLIRIPVDTNLIVECELEESAIRSGCKTLNLGFLLEPYTTVKDGIQHSDKSLHLQVNTSKVTNQTGACTYNGLRLNNEVIHINIGENRQSFNDLKCLNFELEKMICIYALKETVRIEMLNRTTNLYQLIKSEISDKREHWFTLKVSNPFDRFMFRVSMNHSNGTALVEYFPFETETIVVLPKIFLIVINNLTSDMAIATWKLPEIYNKYEFVHSLKLKRNGLQVLSSERVKTSNSTGFITFESDINLPFANTIYTLTINMCIKNAKYSEQQYSIGEQKFKSKKRSPDTPPELMPNSFEYNEYSNDVIIYWKPTSKNRENGDMFAIKILSDNITVTLNNTWAILHNLNRQSVYDIRLVAKNSEGESTNCSTITIPKYENLLDPPQNLRLLVNESLYQLSWSSNVLVDNFTIFSCKPRDERQTKCQTFIDSKTIPGHQTNFTFNNSRTNRPKVFAISSNFAGNTSGMKWFTCVTSTKNEMVTVNETNIISINATSVKLNWTLPCEASPFVKAINIFYCEIELHMNCTTDLKHPVNQPSEVIIDGLVPYTDYTFRLSMYDGNKYGPVSEIHFETEFDVPDAPTSLIYSNITNNSVDIFWTPPINWHGKPGNYNVVYTNLFESHSHYSVTNCITLKNLRNSVEYKIHVTACHNICSAPSNEIVLKTKIGKPGKITSIELDGIYEWSPPTERNGDVQLYEIKFDILMDGKGKSRTSLLSMTKCTLALATDTCIIGRSIRVINLNEAINTNKFTNNKYDTKKLPYCHDELKIDYTELCKTYVCIPGEWESYSSVTGTCSTSYIAVYVVVSFYILGITLITIRIGIKRYKIIKDLHVSMPSGLDTVLDCNDKCNDKQCDLINEVSQDEEPQTITCEELQHELELRDIQEQKIITCASISMNGNYVQVQRQNNGYFRIPSVK